MASTKTRKPERAADETTATFNLGYDLKAALAARTELSEEMSLARLIRFGLKFHEQRGWKDVPQVFQGDLPPDVVKRVLAALQK